MIVESLTARLEHIKGDVEFMLNHPHHKTVGDMINTTKSYNEFPEDLEAEIKALETPSRTKAEVVMLADERDLWKVQLSFAKDWILTFTIKKEGINKEGKDVSVLFCNPCSYKGYPLCLSTMIRLSFLDFVNRTWDGIQSSFLKWSIVLFRLYR
jgi:hypothetical protein